MSISLLNIFPLKGQTDVSVNSDIVIELNSTSDFIPSETILIINDVEVQPSAYFLTDKNTMRVTFFSRRKIKYSSKRYGEEGATYGAADIYPSSFHYGKEYVCSLSTYNIDGEERVDKFSFSTEEGAFYSNKNNEFYYYSETQEVANYLPEWSRARYDKFSNFQQIVNGFGKYLHKLEKTIDLQTSNYFVQTSNMNELANVYKVQLDGSFEFKSNVKGDGEEYIVPPEVIARDNITIFSPEPSSSNSIDDFYYDTLPTRVESSKIKLDSLTLLDNTLIHKTRRVVNVFTPYDSYIWFNFYNGSQFSTYLDGRLRSIVCRVNGITTKRRVETEDIYLLENSSYRTKLKYKKINYIEFINHDLDSNLDYSVTLHQEDSSALLDNYLSYIDIEDQKKNTYWSIAENSTGSVLQKKTLIGNSIEEVLSSRGAKEPRQEYQLYDTDEETPVILKSIVPDLFEDYVYGVDSSNLYIYDKREEYPKVIKELQKDGGSADMVLDINYTEAGLSTDDNIVSLQGVQKIVGRQITRYLIGVKKPDGVVEYIKENGDIVSTNTDAAVYPSLATDQVKSRSIEYELVLPGDYVFYLMAIYSSGERSVDTKIVRSLKKVALAKYKLNRILLDNEVENMFIGNDQQLKIHSSDGYLHTLELVRDNVLIDFSNKTFYFNYKYGSVDIT